MIYFSQGFPWKQKKFYCPSSSYPQKVALRVQSETHLWFIIADKAKARVNLQIVFWLLFCNIQLLDHYSQILEDDKLEGHIKILVFITIRRCIMTIMKFWVILCPEKVTTLKLQLAVARQKLDWWERLAVATAPRAVAAVLTCFASCWQC